MPLNLHLKMVKMVLVGVFYHNFKKGGGRGKGHTKVTAVSSERP